MTNDKIEITEIISDKEWLMRSGNPLLDTLLNQMIDNIILMSRGRPFTIYNPHKMHQELVDPWDHNKINAKITSNKII